MAPPSVLLRGARHKAGLTQAELANRLGVTQGAVAQLERLGANPSIATLEAALMATGHRLTLRTTRHLSDVDETLLARNLRLTPAERLAAFETAHAEVDELRQAFRARARG